MPKGHLVKGPVICLRSTVIRWSSLIEGQNKIEVVPHWPGTMAVGVGDMHKEVH